MKNEQQIEITVIENRGSAPNTTKPIYKKPSISIFLEAADVIHGGATNVPESNSGTGVLMS